jgi:hypothetical protein
MAIEKIKGPFLFDARGIPTEYAAGLKHAIALGCLELRESGTFVKLRQIVCLASEYSLSYK